MISRGKAKDYFKIIRKGYKNIPAAYGLMNFAFIALAGLFAFLLLIYEPASQWHNTSFALSRIEYRYSRGIGGLYLYTTDGKQFWLNQNEEEIQYQLNEGQQYDAVYSDDLFYDTIQGLKDADREYINADEMRQSYEREHFWLSGVFLICLFLLLTVNAIYVISCIRREKTVPRH